MKCAVSLFQHPPTSTTKTTRSARPFSPESSGENGFLPAACQNDTVVVCSSWPGRPIPPERRHHRRVNGQLGSLPQCQTVRQSLQCAPVQRVENCQVRVADEHVRGDPSACLPPDLRCGALKKKSSLPQHPCLWARCAMVAKHVELAATSAGAVRQDKKRCNLRHRSNRKGWGAILVALEAGNAVRAAEAKGPCWDFNIALRAVIDLILVPPQPEEGRRTTLSRWALPGRPLPPTLCTPAPPGNKGQFPPPVAESWSPR